MTLIRAVMDAVNDLKPAEATKQLVRLTEEVFKQEYIMMNEEITELSVIINEFRKHQVTQNLAIQNFDNVLNNVMLDNFSSVEHASLLENPDFIEVYQEKRQSELLAETKLESLAAQLMKEYNSETSQDAEEILELVIQYRQKTIKYAKMKELLDQGRTHQVEQHLLDELELLRLKEKTFQSQINKLRQFYENVFLTPLESAKL